MRAAMLVLVAGCAKEAAPLELAPLLRMTGQASGEDATGRSADCSLDLIFEVQEEVAVGAWTGVHGGEVFRTITETDDTGLAFHADVFGDVGYVVNEDSDLRLYIPVNNMGDSRFWHELAMFEGTLDEDGVGSGPWTCAPLDIDSGGYVDTDVVVDGTWELAPEEG